LNSAQTEITAVVRRLSEAAANFCLENVMVLIYPRYAYQFLSKSVKYCRIYDKNIVVVFMPHSVYTQTYTKYTSSGFVYSAHWGLGWEIHPHNRR